MNYSPLFALMISCALLGAGCLSSESAPVTPSPLTPLVTTTPDGTSTTSTTPVVPPLETKEGTAKVKVTGSLTVDESYKVRCRETNPVEHMGYTYVIDPLGAMAQTPGKFLITLQTADRLTGVRKLADLKANTITLTYQEADRATTYNFSSQSSDRTEFTVDAAGKRMRLKGNFNEMNDSSKRIAVDIDASCTP